MRRVRVAAAALAIAAASARGQPTAPPDDPFPFGGASLRISVLTVGPGNAVFERFGHNALRIQDALSGMDLAYNWGMFSFDEPRFLQRFLSGDTRYWVEAFPSSWLIEAYIAQDRSITEQVLALSEAERTALARRVVENAKPANRFYRYDYFLDNCSTRVRDALDLAMGGALRRRFEGIATPWTYRSESVRLTTPDALPQAGIDLALGPRADRPLSAWAAMFIPMRLRDDLRRVTVAGPDGTPIPFVVAEQELHRSARAPEPAEARGLSLGAWGPILGAWMLLLAPFAAAGRRRTRLPAAVMAVLWYGLTGLVGALILGMWLGSAHVFWYWNLNVLLASPLGLLAALPAARAIRRGTATRVARVLVLAIVAQALLGAVVAFVGPQEMSGPLLLLLPAHLGFGLAFWRHTREAAPPVAVAPAA